jgi:hypothetical protein
MKEKTERKTERKQNGRKLINQYKRNPWPESASELYRPSDRRLSVKLVSIFAYREVSHSQRDWVPTAVFSAFWAAVIASKYLLSCTHETEWTPFQTHYFSENLIAPGIEPGALDL